jgi:hypothetical protein
MTTKKIPDSRIDENSEEEGTGRLKFRTLSKYLFLFLFLAPAIAIPPGLAAKTYRQSRAMEKTQSMLSVPCEPLMPARPFTSNARNLKGMGV